MADIPEHLLKRAQQARSRLSGDGETGTAGASEGAAGGAEGAADDGGVAAGAAGGGDATVAAGSAADTGKIPAHLLDRTTPVADRPNTPNTCLLYTSPSPRD